MYKREETKTEARACGKSVGRRDVNRKKIYRRPKKKKTVCFETDSVPVSSRAQTRKRLARGKINIWCVRSKRKFEFFVRQVVYRLQSFLKRLKRVFFYFRPQFRKDWIELIAFFYEFLKKGFDVIQADIVWTFKIIKK